MQKRRQIEDDDCFSACVESILELPSGTVPNFCEYNDMYLEANKWLKVRGWQLFTVPYTKKLLRDNTGTGYVIVKVKGEAPDAHAVVGKITRQQLKIIFDPGNKPNEPFHYPPKEFLAIFFIVPLFIVSPCKRLNKKSLQRLTALD